MNKHCVPVSNLHTTTCNLLVNFTTPTHSVCRSSLQADYRCTGLQSFLTSVQSTHNVCMQLCTYQYSLSFCVHVVSCNLILFCFVIQNDDTPLLRASLRGHTEIVAILLKFGADFSSCDTVSTSYFITPISAVSEYVDVYTYINIDPCNPRHTYAQRGLLYLVCVSVCLHLFLHYRHQTGS